jgi:signal transduction histidine kinase
MKLYRYLKIYTIGALFLIPESKAQISQSLYKQLPASIKPKDADSLRISEVNCLLKHWFEYAHWDRTQHAEMDRICRTHAGRHKLIDNTDEQVDFLHSVCSYLYYSTSYAQERDERLKDQYELSASQQALLGLYYCEIFLKKFKNITLPDKHFLSNIYLFKAHFLMAIEKHADAYHALVVSRNIARKAGKPTSESVALSSMGFLVETLGLCDLAIRHYDQSYEALKNEPIQNKWVTGQRVYLYYSKQRTYFARYIRKNNPSLLDSIQNLHNNIIKLDRIYNGGMQAGSHLAMAGVNYCTGHYDQAIAHVDTARSIYPNLKARGLEENALAFKAVSLIKLGKIRVGKKMISDMNFTMVNNPIIERILNDLYEIEQQDGNHKKAMQYQQILITHLKRKSMLDLRGRSLEMEQFYKVREQQTKIDNLNVIQRRNTSISILLLLILIIVSAVIYYRYTLGKTNGKKLINQVEKMTHLHAVQIAEAKNLERKKMAQDLHDDLSASLAANMNYLRLRAIQASSEREKQNSLALLDMLQDSYDRVRKKSHTMYWEQKTEGFIRRLEQMVDVLFFGTDTKISLVSDIDNFELNAEAKETVLLILKETITNIIRHANASEAEITFYLEADSLILDIADNGRGLKKKKNANSLGFESLQKRIGDLNGILKISQNQPSGTIVSCSFPLGLVGNFKYRTESPNIF